jgi:hypothetical protein
MKEKRREQIRSNGRGALAWGAASAADAMPSEHGTTWKQFQSQLKKCDEAIHPEPADAAFTSSRTIRIT